MNFLLVYILHLLVQPWACHHTVKGANRGVSTEEEEEEEQRYVGVNRDITSINV